MTLTLKKNVIPTTIATIALLPTAAGIKTKPVLKIKPSAAMT